MSESSEDTNDKNSWVFVEPKNEDEVEDLASKSIIETASNVENVKEDNISEPHADSDTDSISVISESSCKTDEDDVGETNTEEICNGVQNEDIQEIVQSLTRDLIPESPRSQILTERFFNFGTSTICVFAIIGLGIAVQHYLTSGTEELDNFYYEDMPSYTFNVIDKDDGAKTKSYTENYDKKAVHDKSNNYKINEYKEKRRKRHESENYQIKHDKSLKNINKFNQFNFQNSSTDESSVNSNIRSDESFEDKIEKLKIKEDYLTKKEKFLIEKEHDLIKQEMQLNTEKLHDKSSQFTETKKHKRKQKHEQKLASKDTKTKISEKPKHFELKSKGTKNDKTKKDKFEQNNDFNDKRKKQHRHGKDLKIKEVVSNKNSKYQGNFKKRNVIGDWYINLHKARLNIREKEKASDWVFDRAYIRNLKRNKAHWYFQWMVDRDRLRVK